MHVTILITKGGGKARKVSLELPVIIGRAPDVELSIAHPAVSRQHCEITESAGFVKMRDLGSTNGTRVNGKKVPEAVLRPQGKFSIGPFTFQVNYQYVGEATQYIPDFDEEQEEDVAPQKGSPKRHGPPVDEPPDDWGESDDVYGLAVEPDSPAEAADATPPSSVMPKPGAAQRSKEEPRRGDFMRTAKAPHKRLPDAPAPAKPEKGYDLKREPPAESAPGDPPQTPKPRKPSPAPAPVSPDAPFDLERELDEMLDGLKGMDLNEFLKGII